MVTLSNSKQLEDLIFLKTYLEHLIAAIVRLTSTIKYNLAFKICEIKHIQMKQSSQEHI